MEQVRTFNERRQAESKNNWKVKGIDYSQLEQGIETIILQDIIDESEHTATISNRHSADEVNIVLNLDGKGIPPLGISINIVNAIIDYRGKIGVNLGYDGLLTSLDLKAFLYIETFIINNKPSYSKYISYGSPEGFNLEVFNFPHESDNKNFSSLLMNSGDHISTLIIGSNENEYYLFDTSDNLHQDFNQENERIQADPKIYGEYANHTICLNKIPMPEEYGDLEKSCKVQGLDCCMDWTMMFNAVIHEYKDINEIIIGRDTREPFLNPEILKETARRVALINESFIGQEYEELLQHLNKRKQSLEILQQLNQNIPTWRKTFNFGERKSSESSDGEYNPESNKNKINLGGRRI